MKFQTLLKIKFIGFIKFLDNHFLIKLLTI
mgnify:CR=1 FL=1